MPAQSQQTSTQSTKATATTAAATTRSGSSNAAKASALTSKTSFPSGTSLKWGDKGALVEQLQQLLTSKGYTVAVTGNYLTKTVAAVTAFQTANGLKADGVAGPVTLGKLTGGSATTGGAGSSTTSGSGTESSTALTGVPSLKIGSSGAQVKLLQERLKHYGASITVDGDFGSVTDREVKKFQKANGLKEDGVVGPVTAGKLASSTAKSISAGTTTSSSGSSGSSNTGTASKSYLARAKIAVDAAMGQQGVPYVYGTYSPGKSFDCSGLTYWAWKQAGVSLPLNSQWQLDDCQKITAAELVPGDLVFFKTGVNQAVPTAKVNHVGMYIGNGQMIHAPRTGDVVKVATCKTASAAGFGRPG
jgi:cell wall-associated NlpC family hydrolase